MTLILKQVFGLLKMLNSETGTNQIAAGVACGLILGFSPALSLQSLFVIVIILLFRVQLGAALIFAGVFAIPAFLLDPLFHSVGSTILEMKSLHGVFTTLYNMPIIPFTKFNNSVVMGAGVVAILLAPVMYVLTGKLIVKYRVTVVARFKSSKFWKFVQATSLFKWYAKYDQFTS